MEKYERELYLNSIKARYHKLDKKSKGAVLKEIQEKLGVGYRQAIRLTKPRKQGRPLKPKRVGRKGIYQREDFKKALKEIWKLHDYSCSGILKADMKVWVKSIEEYMGVKYDEEVRALLLSVSRATIDRILKEYKGLKGKSTTRPSTFRKEIPVQKNIWDVKIPGHIEADTVAHCGGSLSGEFIYSFTSVDINTLWTEARCTYGKGSLGIVRVFEDIEDGLPFDLKGYDSDNGTEMLNTHMLKYLNEERLERGREPIIITRSREYQSNDNSHVEQRNDTIARRYLNSHFLYSLHRKTNFIFRFPNIIFSLTCLFN
ncbi:MAG: integrase [Bdellovibrionota bacterium]